MTTQELIAAVNERGMRLEPLGDGVLTITYPKGQLSPEFEAELRAHKSELSAWLQVEHLVKQVMAGEFDGDVDAAVMLDVAHTLKASGHPRASAAIHRLFNRPATV